MREGLQDRRPRRGREAGVVRPGESQDAGDGYRLIATTDPVALAAVFDRCARHETFGASSTLGREHFTTLFADGGIGVDPAVQDLAEDLDDTTVQSMRQECRERP